MRFAATALVIICACALLPATAVEEDTKLQGKVTESTGNRLPRPAVQTAKAAPVPAGSRHAAQIDVRSFDLNAHKHEIQAGFTRGVLPGWVQAQPVDPKSASVDLDKFFAFVRTAPPPNPHVIAHFQNNNFLANNGLPPGFNVFVRIGLCGVWDRNGDGARRWRVLATEMHSPGPLREGWQLWQKQVSDLIESHADALRLHPGVGSLHLVVFPNGAVNQISPYSGGERPFRNVASNPDCDLSLSEVVQSIGGLPKFPDGSMAQECHVLVFFSNN